MESFLIIHVICKNLLLCECMLSITDIAWGSSYLTSILYKYVTKITITRLHFPYTYTTLPKGQLLLPSNYGFSKHCLFLMHFNFGHHTMAFSTSENTAKLKEMSADNVLMDHISNGPGYLLFYTEKHSSFFKCIS
jgi:hypothetical protein